MLMCWFCICRNAEYLLPSDRYAFSSDDGSRGEQKFTDAARALGVDRLVLRASHVDNIEVLL